MVGEICCQPIVLASGWLPHCRGDTLGGNHHIKNKIFHNNTIYYVDEYFPIHVKKPLLETRQKVVSENKIYSVIINFLNNRTDL